MNALRRLLLLLLLAPAGCAGDPGCDGERLTVEGDLVTLFSSIRFTQAHATLSHVRHDDPWEDGRIDRVVLELAVGGDCSLSLTAEGCADEERRLPITQMIFVAGAACPDLGTTLPYVMKKSEPIGDLQLEDVGVPGRDRARACFDSRITVRLEGSLHPVAGGDDPLQVLPTTLTVEGTFVSTGIASEAAACGDAGSDVIIGGDVGGVDVGGVDVGAEVIPGEPSVALTIQCPECKTDATVRVNGTPGDSAGMPAFVFVFHEPEFPVEVTLGQARDPAGVALPWPAGSVTFQAYQDTVPGGSVAEPGEPLSPPVTVELVPDQVNAVTLVIDATGETLITCTPEAWFCVDLGTAAECNAAGDFYEETTCPFGNKCSEITGTCAPMVCGPASVACATPTSWRKCLPSGTGWSVETACLDGKVCAKGICMKEECLSQVVFLVDTSQSMNLHWGAVAASIGALTSDNPLSTIGLATFPEFMSICEVPQDLKVPFAAGAGPDVAAWFEEHQPFGQTPLLAAMNHMAAVLPDIFPGGGALVVLSDGADTCAYSTLPYEEREALIVGELGAVTAGLFADHGIKTVVVGYLYEGNTDQLNAIALSGGTGMASYTEAGNEEELTMALVALVEDLKECFN
ncbi:MAG: vWA domain-containing protein [Pseudomonadota bacterium]